jgi:hypothetical protein
MSEIFVVNNPLGNWYESVYTTKVEAEAAANETRESHRIWNIKDIEITVVNLEQYIEILKSDVIS